MKLDIKYVLVLIVQFPFRECTTDNYGDNVNILRACDVLLCRLFIKYFGGDQTMAHETDGAYSTPRCMRNEYRNSVQKPRRKKPLWMPNRCGRTKLNAS
jgi:hypothetical protein